MAKLPIELIDKISDDFDQSLDKHLKGTEWEKNIQPVLTIFLLREIGHVLVASKFYNGEKAAKKLRELISQRIHACPLDEIKNDLH